MYPKAEKMTKPARMLVRELMMDIVRVSLPGKEDVYLISLSYCPVILNNKERGETEWMRILAYYFKTLLLKEL